MSGSAVARQGATLREVDHRPWPLPSGLWIMGQTWEDLLFAHWRVPQSALRELVPPALALDTFEGETWVSVTPFRLGGLRLRGTPPVPRLSSFLELNVRTYVTAGGKPGIFFFSLDASSSLAVQAARLLYKLPYFRATMSARRQGERILYSSERQGEWIRYSSERPGMGAEAASFRGSYQPVGKEFAPAPESLEHFLTERYCLYTVDRHRETFRAEIHHPRWSLQLAEAEIELNTMIPRGLSLVDDRPLLRFARRQDVVVWPLQAVR